MDESHASNAAPYLNTKIRRKKVNKMIYDYRQDIINLINHTENNEQSLSQTLYCLQVISKALLNGQYLQKPLNDILQNKTTSELSDSKTSKKVPSETKDESTTTKSPLKIIKKADKPAIYLSSTYVNNKDLVSYATQNHTLSSHEYVARRNLNSVALLDIHGNQIALLNESAIHSEDIISGDIVTAIYRYGQYVCQHVLHQYLNIKALSINELNYGKVQENEFGKLYVTEDINGNPLSAFNPEKDTYEISNKVANEFNILSNSTIDLVWYDNAPEKIKIRWVHHDEPTDFHPIGKHVKKSKETNNNLDNDTKLDFDLHGQTVNVLIGDSLHEQEIKDLIESHHGTPIITDAFIHSDPKKTLENALNSTDIVILVQNLNKHSTSKTISTIIKNQNIKFAISNSAGIQSIERAIYRADQELPAYESMGSEINYPVA